MGAWQFIGTNRPLAFTEVARRRPGPGEVVVDVKAAGLCGADVGVLHDESRAARLVKIPITPGHEVAGEIAVLGRGVTGWRVGDRVGVCPGTRAGTPGFDFDGGFGERVVVDAGALVRIPDNVTMAEGAVGTDAGMTSYRAVMASGAVKAGDKVGIVGLGGAGQIGLRVAVTAGAQVWAADPDERVWPLAERFGAKEVARSIEEFTDVGLDTIIHLAASPTNAAIATVRRGARVEQVGAGTRQDIAGIYALISSGRLTPAITEISFEHIPEGIRLLRDGEVSTLLVATRD